jgi:type I restriction-modification system DNA methylase subunit
MSYLNPTMLDRSLSIEDVAIYVGVSTSTIRNWVKANHLKPHTNRPLSFREQEVRRLKNELSSGIVARLRTRANKSTSSNTSTPIEYADSTLAIEIVKPVVEIFQRHGLELRAALFLVSMRVLELRGEVAIVTSQNLFDTDNYRSWRRQSLKQEMHEWQSTLTAVLPNNRYSELYHSIDQVVVDDILGLAYQALNQEGDKSTRGSYYTPAKVVADSLSNTSHEISSFLDPCCGTGQYMLYAAKILGLPLGSIYGFDNDEMACRIARINLLLAFPDLDSRPSVHCLNSITELATGDLLCPTNHLSGSMDFVATNPPWGAYKNTQLPARLTNGIRSNETFSLFLAKSMKLTRLGGRLSFILPESILKIRIHSDIRELILKHSHILKISKLGRQFSGVFTPVIRLDLVNEPPKKGATVSIEENGHLHQIEQERFLSNEHYNFDVNVTEAEDQVLKKLYSIDFITLRGNSEWALGVVTGNNKRYVKEQPERELEAIYKGSDIRKYVMQSPSAYILFTPSDFQQVAKIEFYRAPEKLIYKFISNFLVFAYDDRRRITLNSANILIPRIPGISAKVALAFLNSNVFQYIFSKKFSTHKVLRGDLEQLPFPKLSEGRGAEIEKLVDNTIDGRDFEPAINELIYAAFCLTPNEISEIEAFVQSKSRKSL